jgi:hypothetical protein
MSIDGTTMTSLHWSMSMDIKNSTYYPAKNSLMNTDCMLFLSHMCCNWEDSFCRGTQIWRNWRCTPSYKGRSDLEEAGCRRCRKIYLKAYKIGNHSGNQEQAQEEILIWKSIKWAIHLDSYTVKSIYFTECKRYYLSLN